MVMAVWQRTIVDDEGNAVPNATITVRSQTSGLPLASLKTDRDGLTNKGNPFTADADGFAQFFVTGGSYRITATSGAFSQQWDYVAIGTAAETDAGTIPVTTPTVWLFDSDTSSAPDDTSFTLNNADATLATLLRLDDQQVGSVDATTWIDLWDSGGVSSFRGTVEIFDPNRPTELFHRYVVTGDVTTGTGFRNISITWLAGTGTFVAGTEYSVIFQSAGPGLRSGPDVAHVEDFGAVGFELADIEAANSFASIVDDTAAFEAAVAAAISAGHKRIAWNKCHAINLLYDSRTNDDYTGLEFIGPGGKGWRAAVSGILTPYDIYEPALQLGDDSNPALGRIYGFTGHNLKFDDIRYDDGGTVTRGARQGFKTVGFREMTLYNPFFGGFADRAWHMHGGDAGAFFNNIYGARFALTGSAGAASLFAEYPVDSFITTTWFHGVTFDQGSEAEDNQFAFYGIGRDIELTFFGGWAQLDGGRFVLREKESERTGSPATLSSGGPTLNGYDFTVEAAGVAIEVDLAVSGGGVFRDNVNNNLIGTWNLTTDVEIEVDAPGYTGPDTVGTLSGTDSYRLDTLNNWTRRGDQRLLFDSADPTWLLAQEPIAWVDISQATVVDPAEIVKGERYTLFVRALSADRTFAFGDGQGVTTYVSNFSGTVQAGTVTRFDCIAAEIPGGATVLFAVATERFVAAGEAKHWKALTAGEAGQNVNTAQPWFPTSGGVTLQASTTYRFRGSFHSTRAAGTTSHTTSLLFGGTATLTSIAYKVHVKTGDAAGLADSSMVESAVATATQIKAASTSATEVIVFTVEGIVRINAAGTFIPQFQYSAAPGGAPTIQNNTFFELEAIGANTTPSSGPWA